MPSCKDIKLIDCCDAIMDSCTFELDGKEMCLFDSVAQEVVNIAGTEIEFFHLNLEASSRDPLYDEAIERVFQGSYVMKALVEYPDNFPVVDENGIKEQWDASAWISRSELEGKNAPYPCEGDVIRLWKTPFFNEQSVMDQHVPGAGYFFNVVGVDTDGHPFDGPEFVGVKVVLKRSTEYTPERRMASD